MYYIYNYIIHMYNISPNIDTAYLSLQLAICSASSLAAWLFSGLAGSMFSASKFPKNGAQKNLAKLVGNWVTLVYGEYIYA